VTVAPASLCRLTNQLVRQSTRYQALTPRQRTVVDTVSNAACNAINGISSRLTPAQRRAAVTAYKSGVTALQQGGWITATDAGMLKGFADLV